MCQETLELHHGKHHQAYVTALNGFVEKDPSLQGKSLEDIVKLSYNKADMAPVFNNAGQHWNHILFWQNMSPNGGKIPGALEKKITEDFGGVAKFKDAFKAGGVGQFGSGWVWLVLASDGKLKVTQYAERLQPARHRRRQGAARLRRVGAQLLPRLPQRPSRLPAELDRQAGELRVRRGRNSRRHNQPRLSPVIASAAKRSRFRCARTARSGWLGRVESGHQLRLLATTASG